MKTWLKLFWISSALDEGRVLPAVDGCEEVQRFAQDAVALGRGLKRDLPDAEDLSSLHESIMRKVRLSACEEDRDWRPRLAGTLAILFCGLLVAQIFWSRGGNVRSSSGVLLAAAGSALELGDHLVAEAPGVAISPLADEAERLGKDFDSTKEFLLASLP